MIASYEIPARAKPECVQAITRELDALERELASAVARTSAINAELHHVRARRAKMTAWINGAQARLEKLNERRLSERCGLDSCPACGHSKGGAL